MQKRHIIVGLRANQPNHFHEILPGYLSLVTDAHRRWFAIPGITGFFAWTSEPLNALHYDSFAEAEAVVELLVKHDTGFSRPVSILPIYL